MPTIKKTRPQGKWSWYFEWTGVFWWQIPDRYVRRFTFIQIEWIETWIREGWSIQLGPITISRNYNYNIPAEGREKAMGKMQREFLERQNRAA